MLIRFFNEYGTALIAVLILVPVVAFNVALFLERTRRPGPDARGTGRADDRLLPRRRVTPGAAGLGLRRVIAARQDHD